MYFYHLPFEQPRHELSNDAVNYVVAQRIPSERQIVLTQIDHFVFTVTPTAAR